MDIAPIGLRAACKDRRLCSDRRQFQQPIMHVDRRQKERRQTQLQAMIWQIKQA